MRQREGLQGILPDKNNSNICFVALHPLRIYYIYKNETLQKALTHMLSFNKEKSVKTFKYWREWYEK